MKSFEQFCHDLNIKCEEKLRSHYEKGHALYLEKGSFAFDRDRIILYNHKYNIFPNWLSDVLAAAIEVEKDEDLKVFVYMLAEFLESRDDLRLLEMPNRETLATDYAPMFSFLYFLEEMIADMENRGIPFDVICTTLQGFDTEIHDYYRLYGRGGVRIYYAWFALFIRRELLRVGRFQFNITRLDHPVRVYEKDGDVKILADNVDLHKNGMIFGSAGQNDEEGRYHADIEEGDGYVCGYAANELGEFTPEKITLIGYTERIRRGDNIIGVHIPSDGPLDYEYSEKSYKRAWEIFNKAFPEKKFKAFNCFSWLLEKRLRGIMGRDTNITRFADRYATYPIKNNGTAVYSFLFNQSKPCAPELLPEDSSMHRLVKKYLMEGNIFYEKGGFILPEKI